MKEGQLQATLCRAADRQSGYWWVYNPVSGIYHLNPEMQKVVHALNPDAYFEESRSWVVDYDKMLEQMSGILKRQESFTIHMDVRTLVGIETWRVHGEWFTCRKLGRRICEVCRATFNPGEHCRVVLGVSVKV